MNEAAKSKDNQKESRKKNSTLPLLWMKLLKTDIVYGKQTK